jgi:hypothetical protein
VLFCVCPVCPRRSRVGCRVAGSPGRVHVQRAACRRNRGWLHAVDWPHTEGPGRGLLVVEPKSSQRDYLLLPSLMAAVARAHRKLPQPERRPPNIA